MEMSALPDAAQIRAGPAGLEFLQPAPGEAIGAARAFQAIALSCLHRFELHRDLLVRTGDAEALHQTRVALRQLRTAQAIFKDVIADDQSEHFRSEVRWLAAATTEARDLDALLARMPDAPARLSAARARACARATRVLGSARAERLLRDLHDWLANGAWLQVRDPDALSATTFAAASLDRLRDKLASKGRRLRKLDDRALHDVRIAAKKLRYAAWFFSGLFPGDKAQRRADRFVDAMRALQDRLGEVQDIAVAPVTLGRLQIPAESWPRFAKRGKLVRRAAAELERAVDRKPFWR